MGEFLKPDAELREQWARIIDAGAWHRRCQRLNAANASDQKSDAQRQSIRELAELEVKDSLAKADQIIATLPEMAEITDDFVAEANAKASRGEVMTTDELAASYAYEIGWRDGMKAAPLPRVDAEGLRLFAKAVLRDGLWDGSALDGADIQELATKHGLIERVDFDPDKHVDHDGVGLEAGDDWFQETALLAALPKEPQP